MFSDATIEQVNDAMKRSGIAFKSYSKSSLVARASLMRAIAMEIVFFATGRCAIEGKACHQEQS